jgi:hypothetical protein
MRGSDCAGLTFALPAITHGSSRSTKAPTPVPRKPRCDALHESRVSVLLLLMTPTPLKRPRNLRTAPTAQPPRPRQARLHTHTSRWQHRSRPRICARARQTGQELAQHAYGAASTRRRAPRGEGSPSDTLGRCGSPSCNRNPHTTLRIAARWPPQPAPEASGYALLVKAHPGMSRGGLVGST